MKKQKMAGQAQHIKIVLGAVGLTALILGAANLIARDPNLRQADNSSAYIQPQPTCQGGSNGEKNCNYPNPTDKQPEPHPTCVGGPNGEKNCNTPYPTPQRCLPGPNGQQICNPPNSTPGNPPVGGPNNPGGGGSNGGGGSTNVSNADRTITLDKTIVNVTLDRKNAVKGIVYGAGFSIRSDGATIWNIKYKNPIRGLGFDKTAAVIAPGASAALRTAVNTSVPNGTYRGEAVVEYFKNNRWNQGPSVFYTITLRGAGGAIVSAPSSIVSATPRAGGSMLKIYAAGVAGRGVYPDMQVLINDKLVKTFYGVQGNPLIRDFLEYTHPLSSKIMPSQVKIKFINDFDDKQANDDRNLVIDKINIDGYDYETESLNTVSTGTWTSEDGCKEGNKSSEWLMCNGYMQY